MNSPTKLAFTFLILAASAAAATITAAPPEQRTGGKGQNYVNTPHARAVAGVCRFVKDKGLCLKTLKRIPGDDPVELVRSLVLAAETAVRNGLKFLSEIKPKYKGKGSEESKIAHCEKMLNYALDDFAEIWEYAGKNLTDNYGYCADYMMGISVYHVDCIDEAKGIGMKEVESGLSLANSLTYQLVDVYHKLRDIYNAFGITATFT